MAPRVTGRAATEAAAVLAGVLVAGVFASNGKSWSPGCYALNSCDALTLSAAGELVRAGESPYSAQTRLTHISRTRLNGQQPPFDIPFQYPPQSLPVFAVFSLLPGKPWALVWVGTTTLAFGVVAAWFVRRAAPGGTLVLAGLATSGVVALNGFLGQTGAFVGALGAGAVGLWTTRPFVAGLLVGLLSIKPQYALPLIVVAGVRRERSILLGATASFGALFATSAVLYGPRLWLDFFSAVGQPNPTLPFMVSWAGLAHRLAPQALLTPELTMAVYAAGTAVLIGALAWTGPTSLETRAECAVTLAWALVLSPNTHPYDLLLLAPALALLAARWDKAAIGVGFFALSWIAIVPGVRWALSVGLLACAAGVTRLALTSRQRTGTATGTSTPTT